MKIKRFLKQNTVLCVAFVAALITGFLVPPDREWLGYFDKKTLVCLFLTLAVICALRDIKFFSILARKLVRLAGNLRSLSLALIYITFLGSMLIANDMALITFLPLGYFALDVTHQQKHMAYVFILQNISANLGGMLTPFGNPQNLYLYSYFHIPTGDFVRVMLPPFLLAVALLTGFCLLLPRQSLRITEVFPEELNWPRTVLYLGLFALSLLIVFRVLPYWLGLAIVPAVLLVADRDALLQVDYPLLATFALFFIFAGNLSRVPAVHGFLSGLLRWDPLLVPVLSCQVISNVPTAILLSRFTQDWQNLLLGVNIGGTGTLIASLASLITFSEFRLLCPGQTKRYLVLFAALNGVFLVTMTLAAKFLFPLL